MRMQKVDLSVCLVSFALALYFFIGSLKFPESLNKADVGPAAFPQIISIVVMLLTVMLALNVLLKKDGSEVVKIKRFKNIVASIGMIILYAISISSLGFYLASAIYFPVMLFIASETNWKTIILITLLFEVFAYGVFSKLLGVPLP